MSPIEKRVAKIRNLLQPIALLLDPDALHLLQEVDDARVALDGITKELDAMLETLGKPLALDVPPTEKLIALMRDGEPLGPDGGEDEEDW